MNTIILLILLLLLLLITINSIDNKNDNKRYKTKKKYKSKKTNIINNNNNNDNANNNDNSKDDIIINNNNNIIHNNELTMAIARTKTNNNNNNNNNNNKNSNKKNNKRTNKVEMNVIEDYINGSLNFQWYKDYNDENKKYYHDNDGLVLYNCNKTEYNIPNDNICQNELQMKNIYFHSVFDVSKPSSVSLTVKQICRALSLCINKKNFRIVLNVSKTYNREYTQFMSYKSLVMFLESLSINFSTWLGNFDTYALTEIRMKSLSDVNDYNDIIFQVDADEFPIFDMNNNTNTINNSINKSLINKILNDNKCDVVYGKLLDAISSSKKLINVTWDKPLDEQFSSVCDAKKHVEHANAHKLILYRGIYRPLPGNHRLRCEISSYSIEECNKSNNTLIPKITKKPKNCYNYLKIKHYKYVWGIEEYLKNRAYLFKKAHIPWYKESLSALNYLRNSNGTICL
jgi:hypothetical protein